jgi:uncharacterized membrane protein
MHVTSLIAALLPVAFVAILLPFMGRNRRGVLFGVSVSLEFAGSPEAQASLNRYRVRSISIGAAVFVLTFAALVSNNQKFVLIMLLAGVPLMLAGALVLWVREHNLLKSHAATVPIVRSAELAPRCSSTAPIYAAAASLLPLVAEAFWLRLHWSEIPARWPQHWNAAGQVNGWGHRGGGVFAPLIMGAMILLLITGISAFMRSAPGTQTRQRSRAQAPLAALAWLLAAMFCFVGLLPFARNLSPATIALVVVVNLVATFGVVIWLLWRTAMMPGAMPANEPYDGTPDAAWRAGGLVYFNPADAAVLVPKRFGWGWTLNFARPISWIYIGVVILVALASIAIPAFLR